MFSISIAIGVFTGIAMAALLSIGFNYVRNLRQRDADRNEEGLDERFWKMEEKIGKLYLKIDKGYKRRRKKKLTKGDHVKVHENVTEE